MKLCMLAVCAIVSAEACAEPAGHWGVGMGSNYGGPGIKFSQGISDNIEFYVNGGSSTLFSLLSYHSGSVVSAGAEYAIAGNQHHTLVIGYALLTGKQTSSWDANERRYIKERERLRGSVYGYTYYFSGLKAKGQALGVSMVYLEEKKEMEPMQTVGNTELRSLSVSWGYRF